MFEAFQLGPFLFRTHILLLLIGFVLGVELFLRLAAHAGLHTPLLEKKKWWLLLGFLLGGRLLGMILLYRVYVQDPLRIFVVWDGVFNSFGSLLGMWAVLYVITFKDKGAFLKWMDAIVPAATLFLSFEWLGRFFGSLAYGKPTEIPWGVTLESMSVRYTVPIHPVQLYYALWFLAVTVALLILRKRGELVEPVTGVTVQRKKALFSVRSIGSITFIGITLSCLGILCFEYLRGDFAITVFAKLSDFLFLSLLFVSLGAIAVLERKISHRYSIINSLIIGIATIGYIFVRPLIAVAAVEWRLSQFIAVLAVLATIVYVVVHRWKYQRP